jgi:hypothetical protein
MSAAPTEAISLPIDRMYRSIAGVRQRFLVEEVEFMHSMTLLMVIFADEVRPQFRRWCS